MKLLKKKTFKGLLLGLVTVAGLFVGGIGVNAARYPINDEFNLPAGAGDSRLATPNYIILHETANPRATGRNEATYMRNNWMNAYTTHIVGDGGIVYRVGETGYISWGALNANPYAPAQIELQHSTDPTTFQKNYTTYINLARDLAKQFNIPLTLDTSGRGIKTHQWVTNNYGGDHTDPYGYLAKMGVSKAKLANDLANGIGGNTSTPTPEKPKPVDPTTAGAGYSVMDSGNNHGHVDRWGKVGNTLVASGWHIANYKYEYVFVIDRITGKEVARVKADGAFRPDVNNAYKTIGDVGFNVTFDANRFKGRSVVLMMRATNDPAGNTAGGAQDFTETRWYHDM